MDVAFVVVVERLGMAVESGELSLTDAATALIEARAGGLTRWSAVYELRNWRSARSRYDTEYERVVDLQISADGVDGWASIPAIAS